MATSTADAGDANRRTIAGYENCARDYAAAVERVPAGVGEAALRRLADGLSRGARALEIGSGPGWDADSSRRSASRSTAPMQPARSARSRPSAVTRWRRPT